MWAGLAGLGLAMLGMATARAATVTYEGTSTAGDAVTINVTTDDANLGAGDPPYLSFLDLQVVVGDETYAVDQTYYRLFDVGDRITSGTLDGAQFTLTATDGPFSGFFRPTGTELLTSLSLTFAQEFSGPLTIDSLFAYLGSAQLIAAGGIGDDGLAFELAPPNAVPVPAAAFLFLGGLGALVGRRVVELAGAEAPPR